MIRNVDIEFVSINLKTNNIIKYELYHNNCAIATIFSRFQL
jgi:hypothetical protein